jgi:hypothetical protein
MKTRQNSHQSIAIRPEGLHSLEETALNACMRKRLTILNAMARSNQSWTPTTQPETV